MNMTYAEYMNLYHQPNYDFNPEEGWVDVNSLSEEELMTFLLDDCKEDEFSLDDLYAAYGVFKKKVGNATYALYKVGETYLRGEWGSNPNAATFEVVISDTDPDWVFWEEK